MYLYRIWTIYGGKKCLANIRLHNCVDKVILQMSPTTTTRKITPWLLINLTIATWSLFHLNLSSWLLKLTHTFCFLMIGGTHASFVLTKQTCENKTKRWRQVKLDFLLLTCSNSQPASKLREALIENDHWILWYCPIRWSVAQLVLSTFTNSVPIKFLNNLGNA